MEDMSKVPRVEYVAGAGGDGYGFFPVISCFAVAPRGKQKTRWVLHHPLVQYRDKEEAVVAADAEIAGIFEDHRHLVGSPDRFAGHLRARGFTELKSFVIAKSFDEDRRSALGDAFEPAVDEIAARSDPALHAKILETVDTQIAEGTPPETRLTFERLVAEGYGPVRAKRLIGVLVAIELTDEFVFRQPFNEKRFVEFLRKLPELPPPDVLEGPPADEG